MESADFYDYSVKIENFHKMEVEQAHNINHSNMIKNYIFARRNISTLPFNQKFQDKKKFFESFFNSNLVLKNIDEIIAIFNKLYNSSSLNNNKKEIDIIKNTLIEYLKQIRKELSKENISLIEAKSLFNEKMQKFIELLLKDEYDPYIQLESLWIINNLMFLVAKYNNNIFFDVQHIANLLLQYLINIYKNQKNEGVKYTLGEKILRIFGNLIHINNNIIDLLIKNQIIPFIINSLNSPVSSFRTACLWLINKIIFILIKLKAKDYLKIFTEKDAISNYKFILTRIENQHSFDEIGELFWLFNELVKYNSSSLVPIFFSDFSNINNNNDLVSLNKEFALKNFEFVLNNCLTTKMIQTCFRLISNLLIVCMNDVKDNELLAKLIDRIYLKQSILGFINDILNSPKNKYDPFFIKDILLLIFNLIGLSKTKSCIIFRNGIVNLINDKDYQNDNEIMKLLIFIYYKILSCSMFLIEQNDDNTIKTFLAIMERFKDDSSILIIFIDILFYYLKASHIKIGNDIEFELNLLSNSDKNIPIEKLQIILLKFSNFIKLPLS